MITQTGDVRKNPRKERELLQPMQPRWRANRPSESWTRPCDRNFEDRAVRSSPETARHVSTPSPLRFGARRARTGRESPAVCDVAGTRLDASSLRSIAGSTFEVAPEAIVDPDPTAADLSSHSQRGRASGAHLSVRSGSSGLDEREMDQPQALVLR